MKTKHYFFLFAMALAVMFTACDETTEPESCDGEDIAEDLGCPTDVSIIATFCSDGVNDSYYTYNGEDYMCKGVGASTCDSALLQIGIQVILDNPECSDKKSAELPSNIKLSKMAEALLTEVRSKSLCN